MAGDVASVSILPVCAHTRQRPHAPSDDRFGRWLPGCIMSTWMAMAGSEQLLALSRCCSETHLALGPSGRKPPETRGAQKRNRPRARARRCTSGPRSSSPRARLSPSSCRRGTGCGTCRAAKTQSGSTARGWRCIRSGCRSRGYPAHCSTGTCSSDWYAQLRSDCSQYCVLFVR